MLPMAKSASERIKAPPQPPGPTSVNSEGGKESDSALLLMSQQQILLKDAINRAEKATNGSIHTLMLDSCPGYTPLNCLARSIRNMAKGNRASKGGNRRMERLKLHRWRREGPLALIERFHQATRHDSASGKHLVKAPRYRFDSPSYLVELLRIGERIISGNKSSIPSLPKPPAIDQENRERLQQR